jgi:integrase
VKDYTVNIQLSAYSKENTENDKETGILFDVYGKKVQGRFRLASGLFVKEKYFHKGDKEIRRGDTHYSSKNERLKQRLRAIETLCERMVNEDKLITKDYLKQHLDFIDTVVSESPFLDHFDEFIKSKQNDISESTKDKYIMLRKRLINVAVFANRTLTFENIDSKFEASFKEYCFTKKKNFNNGYGGYIKNLKSFLNWATESNLNKNIAFKKFKVLSEDKDIFPLEFEEIAQLENKEFKDEYELVKNMFLLQCYTGMALGDIIDLKCSHINKSVIRKRRIKTKVDCFIPITPKAQKIIDFYLKSKDRKDRTDLIFPNFFEHKFNDYLKEIFEKAELNRIISYERTQGVTISKYTESLSDVITSHDGRRTFITCCLRRGMGHEMIMKITGHKTYTEFRKYVKFSENEIQDTMLNAWSKS